MFKVVPCGKELSILDKLFMLLSMQAKQFRVSAMKKCAILSGEQNGKPTMS